jgi:hypothetical protein
MPRSGNLPVSRSNSACPQHAQHVHASLVGQNRVGDHTLAVRTEHQLPNSALRVVPVQLVQGQRLAATSSARWYSRSKFGCSSGSSAARISAGEAFAKAGLTAAAVIPHTVTACHDGAADVGGADKRSPFGTSSWSGHTQPNAGFPLARCERDHIGQHRGQVEQRPQLGLAARVEPAEGKVPRSGGGAQSPLSSSRPSITSSSRVVVGEYLAAGRTFFTNAPTARLPCVR